MFNLKRRISAGNARNNQSNKDKNSKKKKQMEEEVKEESDVLAELRVCRICLSIDVKMYHIYDHKLKFMYEQLVGITLSAEDRFPKMLCWECVARLSSANKFREKAIISQNILSTTFNIGEPITLNNIKSIKHNLNSTLIQEHPVSHCILHINDGIKIKLKEENSITSDEVSDENTCDKVNELSDHDTSDDDTCNKYEVSDDDTVNEISLNKEDDAEIEIPIEYLENTNEKINMIMETLSVNSDVNDSSSEIKESVKRKNSEVKVRKPRVFKMNGIKVDMSNPLSVIHRYKNVPIKRRLNTRLPIDESLFNITPVSYDEQIAEMEKRKESNSYKMAAFKCTKCYRTFRDRATSEAHVLRHDEKNGAFECFICKSRFKTARSLKAHLNSFHADRYSCKVCPYTTANRPNAKTHENYHLGVKFQCPHCSSEFDKVTTYMNHLRMKHASKFVCGLCGFTFVTENGIALHKRKTHKDFDATTQLEGPYCKECDVRFISDEAHARHLQLSSVHTSDNELNRIRNDSSASRYKRDRLLVRSFKIRPNIHPRPRGAQNSETKNRLITCEKCGVVLSSALEYKNHFRLEHPGETRIFSADPNPFMCEQCGRFFQSNLQLEEHAWVHTGVKGYKCAHCDKSYVNKFSLSDHLRVHGVYRQTYDCNVCGKKFGSRGNRQRHLIVHSNLKLFSCEVCGKKFKTTDRCKSHLEHVHNNKPWPKRVRHKKTNDD